MTHDWSPYQVPSSLSLQSGTSDIRLVAIVGYWSTPGLRRWGWLIELRGTANRSEGLGWPVPVDKKEGFRWGGLAQALSITARHLGGRAGQGTATRSEGFLGWLTEVRHDHPWHSTWISS